MHVYCKLYYKQNLYFHPPYCTTARSQPFASNTFCLQTVAFCTVSSQLRHRRSLTASSVTPASLVNPGYQLADCQVSGLRFQFFGGLYSRVAVFVNIQHNLSFPFPRTAVTIPHKTTQMHNHIFLTALLTRY